MTGGPLVSILIPCFNAERWIGAAIESALAQTWPHSEVIVVDDGSTDGSLAIIKRYEGRIRWESGPNEGGGAARNRLMALARGEWLQYLDADDYLLPAKVARQVSFIEAHPDVDVVFGPVTLERWNDGGPSRLELLPIPPPHDPWILLALWRLPQTGAPLWRRSAVEDAGGWMAGQRVCQEHELYLRLLKAGKRFAYSDGDGAVHRLWSRATVSNRDTALVRAHRLAIEADAEAFLRARGELTPPRAAAIHDAIFGMARVAWREGDRAGARGILERLTQLAPDFAPTAEPRAYRALWRLLGFEVAERLLDWRRAARS